MDTDSCSRCGASTGVLAGVRCCIVCWATAVLALEATRKRRPHP